MDQGQFGSKAAVFAVGKFLLHLMGMRSKIKPILDWQAIGLSLSRG